MSKRVERLAFQEQYPDLEPGRLYCTIRVGEKWLEYRLKGNTDVVMLNGAGRPFGKGTLHSVYYVPLVEVKEQWLLYSFDKDERTLAGLYTALEKRYANAAREDRKLDVNPRTMVTVVFYTLNS